MTRYLALAVRQALSNSEYPPVVKAAFKKSKCNNIGLFGFVYEFGFTNKSKVYNFKELIGTDDSINKCPWTEDVSFKANL